MAKRKKIASKTERKMSQVFQWLPTSEILNPTKPNKRFSIVQGKDGAQLKAYEFCDTIVQYKLHLIADKILKDDGFFDANNEMRAWLNEPENKAWAIAANPHSITSDGHLSASAAFC